MKLYGIIRLALLRFSKVLVVVLTLWKKCKVIVYRIFIKLYGIIQLALLRFSTIGVVVLKF